MKRALSYLASLAVPFALLGLALRLLLTPLYYTVEYNMPYFPFDDYGFSKADRLQWAKPSVQYLVNNADISYLADLKFDGGAPIYSERELSHMSDVKRVVKGALNVWYVSLIVLTALALAAKKDDWQALYLDGLRRGGWWMIGAALALGAVVGAGALIDPDIFWNFFAGFHHLFFDGDTWLFNYSDTLIRLFPIRFWEDAVLALALVALGGGLALALGIKPKAHEV
ncbi:MAG: TIGR01906 family membrane protein [Anaerolineales bacterium]|nr:TIGR01906 family membrane protein [Anaerolineales bacterium]